MNNIKKLRFLAILSIFTAIIIIMTFTRIGFINLIIINATIVHIPVIIGSIVLGARGGAILGFMFGFSSFLNATLNPGLTSFAFSPLIPIPGQTHGTIWALAIAFIPRIMVGVIPSLVYNFLKNLFNPKSKNKFDIINIAIAAIIGSFTNTILVLSGFFIFIREELTVALYIGANEIFAWLLSIVLSSGVAEAIAASIISIAICIPIFNYTKSNKSI